MELPLEIHKEIIDILGEEAELLAEHKYTSAEEGLETLCTLSLACKEWHSLAI